MKCEICKNHIETHFLNKILGTVVKDAKGKKHSVCKKCQTEFRTKPSILEKL